MVPVELLFQEWSAIEKISIGLPDKLDEEKVKTISEEMDSGKIPLTLTFQENGIQIALKTKKRIYFSVEKIKQLKKQNLSVQLSL